MSGSTENLLTNSHLSASKESLDGQYYGAQSRQTRRENQGRAQGMENKGFQDDPTGLEPSSSSERLSISYGTQGNEKRATSFQHASSKEPSRRHSSPDHNAPLRRERSKGRHVGGRRRLSSNIEEDLRRKACLNSMKRHQSANPLPLAGQGASSYSYVTAPRSQSYNDQVREKIQPEEDRRSERSSRESREPTRQVSSSQKDNELQNMQQTIIALEKNQLEQYKKRLTLALSERAKLTGELQMLSESLTQRELESSNLESSLGRSPSSARSSRLSHSLGDLRVPEMYGDYGDISVDFESNLRLPRVPGSAQSRREKMKIPELDLRSLNSSVERISSDHIENPPEGKDAPQPLEGNKDQEEKDYFRKMVDDIWEDNLRGDVLAEERIETKSEDNIQDEIARDSDVNNNEKPPKKRLTVEEFLSNEDSNNQKDKKDLQQQGEVNVLPGYEDMNGVYRGTTPGIYEPVECLLGPQSTQENGTAEQQEKVLPQHGEGLLKLKDDDDKYQESVNSENYFSSSTLPIEKKNRKKEEDKHIQGREPETNLDEKQPQHISRTGRNERRFNYMAPPGARANASINPADKNDYLGRKEKEKEIRRVPSNISDKLQYYRERLSNRAEEESSCDLADAYEREKDPEKRREIQQQAAREAALLRREASALLFEAMNLERICDPNGRVRHVYLPH